MTYVYEPVEEPPNCEHGNHGIEDCLECRDWQAYCARAAMVP